MKIRVALSLWVALCAAPAAAQMYKWVDEKGVTHYSEKPPPGRKAQQMQSAPAAPSAPAASPAEAASTWSDKERDFKRRSIERDQDEQKKRKKESDERQRVAMRREQCMEAQGDIAALNEQRPIYWINEKGEREYLKDGDRPEAMRRAKERVEAYCKPE